MRAASPSSSRRLPKARRSSAVQLPQAIIRISRKTRYRWAELFGMSFHPLNLATAFVGLSLFLTGCGRHDQPQVQSPDAKLRNALIGTWTPNSHLTGLMRVESNGTFFAQWNTTNRPMKVWSFEGTWTATGDVYIATITKSRFWGTTNLEIDGTTDRLRIISLNEKHLVWEIGGHTNSFTRE